MKQRSRVVNYVMIGIGGAFLVGVIHLLWMIVYGQSVVLTRHQISSDKIPKELDGYEIVFFTDTHDLPGEELSLLLQEHGIEETDLILLGGDFGFENRVWEQFQAISQIDSRDGVYAVYGNHDDPENVYQACTTYNFQLLENQGAEVAPGFYVGGVEDLWTGVPNVGEAVRASDATDFTLLLTHNPDVAMEQSMEQIDYVVGGHTHGGHVTLFGGWAPALPMVTNYAKQLKSGEVALENKPRIFISKGTGWYRKAPRVFARPEIVVFELVSE